MASKASHGERCELWKDGLKNNIGGRRCLSLSSPWVIISVCAPHIRLAEFCVFLIVGLKQGFSSNLPETQLPQLNNLLGFATPAPNIRSTRIPWGDVFEW